MDLIGSQETPATGFSEREKDRALVDAFLDGQQAAFSKLVRKYRKQVYAVAFRFTQNHEEADDLTQEVFVKAFQKLNTFRGDASFKTWILRITTNLSINMKKSGRVSKDSGEAPDENLRTDPKGVVEQLVDAERVGHLRRAINRLPPRQRETLLLKTYQHLSCEEVACIMRCSVGTVKANTFNALKNLRLVMKSGVQA